MQWIKNELVPWVKKYWQWIVFPVGIVTALISVCAVTEAIKDYPPPDDLDKETQDYLKKLRSINEERNRRIAELEEKQRERLKELSKDQKKELKELKNESIEEIVQWFDTL